MDIAFYVVGAICGIGILLLVAEPYRFLPEEKGKKKLVGSTYWGIYEGTPTNEPEAMRTIEARKSTRKERYIAGSSTYAAGRGVNMSGK